MLKSLFAEVLEVPGVEAAVLYDNENQVLDSYLTDKLKQPIFGDIGETFLHILGLFEYLEYDFEEIVMPFGKGTVFVRSGDRYYLAIVARPTVDIAYLRLAVEVCRRDFENDRKARKKMKKWAGSKLQQIRTEALDDVEKIMLETIVEDHDGIQQPASDS